MIRAFSRKVLPIRFHSFPFAPSFRQMCRYLPHDFLFTRKNPEHFRTCAFNICNAAGKKYSTAGNNYSTAGKTCNGAGNHCRTATKTCNTAGNHYRTAIKTCNTAGNICMTVEINYTTANH
ncbi:MAG TPA: hypothetical protein VI757_11265 [Bacteroidia bacterium]|nr:hypothetical protein [Bacteroidia bacterium]